MSPYNLTSSPNDIDIEDSRSKWRSSMIIGKVQNSKKNEATFRVINNGTQHEERYATENSTYGDIFV